jgi:(p)ppGpp synthase/HD superfamily hydrolase
MATRATGREPALHLLHGTGLAVASLRPRVPMPEPPAFIAESDLLRSAYEVACAAHHGPAREGDTDIEHPLAVAGVLHDNGFDEHVVAAALLHDVVEDTSLDLATIAAPFGADIARLVDEMTEDESIESYPQRKAEHRRRVAQDRRAAAIYAADKLASTRSVRAGEKDVEPMQLEHYVETLRVMRKTHPDLPFLDELGEELDTILKRRRG